MSEYWQKTTLGESCEFFNGKAHENQIDENGDFIVVNSKFISSDGTKSKKTNHALFPLYQNDIVMVMSDVPKGKAIAKCYLIEEDNKYSLNQRICAIRSKVFNTRFLYYHLNRHPYLLSFDNGENQTNLRKDDILKCPLSIPTLSEQKQIVAILDEAFEGIDRAIANTEKNLTNARKLFESYLSKIFTQNGDGWLESTLGDSCDFYNGKAHEQNIDKDGKFIVVNSKFISSNGTQSKKTNTALFPLYIDDITMVMSDVPKGKALAKCYLIKENEKYSLNQRICTIRSSKFNKKFLFYQLSRHPYLLSFDNGENQTNLRKGDILKCPLYIPELKQQAQMAERLDNFLLETQCLETIYRQKLSALNELKQSILQKAFTGELTADTANQTIEAAEQDPPISQDCLRSAETTKQNVHQSGQLSLWV